MKNFIDLPKLFNTRVVENVPVLLMVQSFFYYPSKFLHCTFLFFFFFIVLPKLVYLRTLNLFAGLI